MADALKAEPEYEFYSHDGAVFRRKFGGIGPWVEDIFVSQSKTWEPYQGDRLEPVFFGSRAADPMAFDRTVPERQYDYFSYDNAIFRRHGWCSLVRSVDDVYDPRSRSWAPYRGDRLAPAAFGDRCEDPERDSGVAFDLD